jgi:hypothetical protein
MRSRGGLAFGWRSGGVRVAFGWRSGGVRLAISAGYFGWLFRLAISAGDFRRPLRPLFHGSLFSGPGLFRLLVQRHDLLRGHLQIGDP